MISGMNPAPMPWMGCGECVPPESTGDSVDLESRPPLLEHLGAPGGVTAGPDPSDEMVEPIGEIAQEASTRLASPPRSPRHARSLLRSRRLGARGGLGE
jgi:hypothetical protein